MRNNIRYRLLKLLSSVLCLLPYRVVLALGAGLGTLFFYACKSLRCRGMDHAIQGLQMDKRTAEAMIRANFRKLGQMALEFLYYPCIQRDNLHKYVEIEGREYLDEAAARKRGVIFLTAHFGNWELLGAVMGLLGYPVASIVKPQPNPAVDTFINDYRTAKGIDVITKGVAVRNAIKALRAGKMISLFIDQDAGPDGIFVNFLGKPASTPAGAAAFARNLGAPVIPIFIIRRRPDGHAQDARLCPAAEHKIIICPPLELDWTGDEAHDLYVNTAKMTALVETMVRTYPDEWLWYQKRWNTPRKAGERR